MSEDKFDAIVVGAGLAGCVAAYALAAEGLEVVLVERGEYAGAKNMTGGRLYAHSLEKVFPGFAKEAPIERLIARETITMLTADDAVSVDFRSPELIAEGHESYSVLPAIFDQWLAEKAEDAGVSIIYGITVEDLIIREGRVCGIVAGEDELESDVVILADGANSMLAQKAGLRNEWAAHQVAVGAKELIELPEQVISDRFACSAGQGAAGLYVGDPTDGGIGGGFIYTNKESISIGIVATLSTLVEGKRSAPAMLEVFKAHPAVAPLIAGGKMIEYSGHIVLEGGYNMLPKLAGDGVLVCGDAAGLCINLGYSVRGMDYAIESGRIAAQAVLKAREAGDFSAAGLACYRTMLESSFVLKDLSTFRKFPAFLEETPRMFKEYPQMASDVMRELFVVDGSPKAPLKPQMKAIVKRYGTWKLLKDARRGMGAL